MKPLTCPIPSNINPLQSNGFQFHITKLPELTYFCNEVIIPDISLPVADTNTALSKIPFVGDKVDFGNLTVQFLIDEEMNNFKAIHNWIISLGFPELHEQYTNFINSNTDSLYTNEVMASQSDATLSILNSSNNVVRTVQFVDIVPVSLGSIQLTSTTDDTIYLAGVAVFDYNYYRFL